MMAPTGAIRRLERSLPIPGAKVVTAEQMELSRLRAENKRLQMELEIAKKLRLVQSVNATPMLAFSLSAGVMKPNVFLGR